MDNNSFEKFPGEAAPTESEIRAAQWESAMSEGVPEFAGDVPISVGGAETTEAGTAEAAPAETGVEDQDDTGLQDAAAIINYGLNTAAREYGVEQVVQKIKKLDISDGLDPIKEIFLQLGVDTPPEVKELQLEHQAIKAKEADFYSNSEVAPATKRRSPEGAFKAIKDMKELILEVEGADPRYEDLRQGAKAAGKGYFEYAVGSLVNRDLTDLFAVLAAQPPVEDPEAQGNEGAPDNEEDPETQESAEGPAAPDNPQEHPLL